MATDREDIVGRLVDGRYRIDSVLARGGMSTVYLATDIRLDRVVAVKVMHRSLAEDHDFVVRFEREAKAAAKLSHPNVVGVFDQGSYDGLVFLVMEYVPGYTLRDVIDTYGALEPARALGVVDQVLLALAAAHNAGFVHRDIKPENALMTADGVVKVADFGLARAMTGDANSATSQGVIIGTVAYLSPEQVETGAADERSDIYATGVMLFELLTGKVPFVAATPLAVAFRHVNEQVPAPSSRQPGVPDYVDELVLTACAKDPDDRYRDAWTFAQALDVAQDRLALGDVGAGDGDAVDDVGVVAGFVDVPDPIAEPQPFAEPHQATEQGRDASHGVAGEDSSASSGTRATATAGAAGMATAAGAAKGFGPEANAGFDPAADEQWDVDGSDSAHGDPGTTGETTVVVTSPDAAESPTAVFIDTTATTPTGVIQHDRSSNGTQVLTRPVSVSPSPTVTGGGGHGGQPPGSKDHEMLGVKPARRGGRAMLVAVLAILAILVGGAAWYLGSMKYVELPDVTGQTVGEASRNLAVLELALVEAGTEASDTVPDGSILRTNPVAGTNARPGSSVEAFVSSGPQLFTVPDVTGQSIDSATAEMKSANLVVANVEQVNNAGVPQGMIVGSQPPSGSEHPAGTEVTLLVSRGSEPIAVPEVTGLTTAAAKTKVTRAGLVPTVREEFATGAVPSGQVMSSEPAAGNQLQPGETVTLVVSKGQEPATVPDVVGMGQQEAVAKLQAAGLTPATTNQLPIVVLDRVYAQDPAAGTVLPRGSTVTLTIV